MNKHKKRAAIIAALLICNFKLLKLNSCANFVKLILDLFSFFLANGLFKSLGSAVNNSLCISKTKAGDLTNNLDNLNLLCASFLKNNLKLGLLFSGSSATSSRSCNCNSSSGRNAKLLFNSLNELRKLKYSKSL